MKSCALFIFLIISAQAFANPKNEENPCWISQLENGTSSAELLKSQVGHVVAKLIPSEFYKKSQNTAGLLVKGSSSIENASLAAASDIVSKMISKRQDIKTRLIANKADIVVIAKSENYCDIPEAQSLREVKTFDGRDFCSICGGGGVPGRPITTVCEDNLLKTAKDPYHGTEDILTHEFAHTMHILGMDAFDKKRVTDIYTVAKNRNIFETNAEGEPTYMMANEQEFFACLSAAWFGVHNPKSPAISPDLVNRDSIKEKLPEMYEFMKSIYPE